MQKVAGKLDEAYKEERAFFQRVRIDQEKIYRAFRLIGEYRDGNKEVLAEIRESHPHFFADIPSQGEISYSNTCKVEVQLVDRLRLFADAREQMQASYELYLNQQKELDEIIQISKEAILKAQASVFVWVRAHRKLKERNC